MGALITENYAKECLDELNELNEAVKINPSMFRKDKVKSFYQDLYGTGDQKIYDVFGAYNKIYATEIRFTEDEFNAVKNVVKEFGFKIINENNMIEYIEIKGEQFFDENNNFINPFDSSENANILAELKYKCMQDNNVKILRKQDLLNLGIKIK